VTSRTRICIVTPGSLGSNPRVVKEAEALSDSGHDVAVVFTRTLGSVDELDHDVLRRAKWQARRLDLRDRATWRLRRVRQSVYARAFSAIGRAGLAEGGFSSFTTPLLAAAKRVPADLYIAHYPAALPAAAAAARRHGARYAYDAEDFHPGDLPDLPQHAREQRMLRAIEGRYLPGCAYVTAASPGIADAYAEAYGIARPKVLLNVFPRAHAPKGPTPGGIAAPGPSVYWFSQTIGPHRGLECAARAIGIARSRPHLYLRGTPAAGFLERLSSIAAESGASDRLHVLAPAAPSEMERLAASYDLGFVGETGFTTSRRIALTNKLFSYLLAGVPAVISDIPAHRALSAELEGTARMYRTDDARDLAAMLDGLLENPTALAGARERAFDLGQTRFNWDVERLVLQELVGIARATTAMPSARPNASLVST